jgi:hypothetical protein
VDLTKHPAAYAGIVGRAQAETTERVALGDPTADQARDVAPGWFIRTSAHMKPWSPSTLPTVDLGDPVDQQVYSVVSGYTLFPVFFCVLPNWPLDLYELNVKGDIPGGENASPLTGS